MMNSTTELRKLPTSAIRPSQAATAADEAATAADTEEAATAADTHISTAPDEHPRGHPSAEIVDTPMFYSTSPGEHLRGHPSELNLDTSPGEHLRGHPYFSLTLPFGRSRSMGGAYFSAVCPCRLSLCVNERLHLCTCDVHRFSVFP